MDIATLKEKDWIIFECISGSKAYGLNTPTSDTDIKGIYILPEDEFFGLNYIPQISNETNDVVYYELKRFVELLLQNNPGMLELLATPEAFVMYKHPVMNFLNQEDFVTKNCQNSFGKFAVSQLKKARGLNKKALNPLPKERKGVLDFCYVSHENGTLKVNDFLSLKDWKQEECGLVNLNHMRNVFGLYQSKELSYSGIVKSNEANDVALSTIPKGEQQETLLYFNREEYSKHCREHKEYWEWVAKRNEERYRVTVENSKNYDAKNMMHVFRLLEMAKEIAETGQVNVYRTERTFLLDVKQGKYSYDQLMDKAEALQHEVEIAFEQSTLPHEVDVKKVNKTLVAMRKEHYELQRNL